MQVDNTKDFSSKLLSDFCTNNNITLIHSSCYHPQTNGLCESIHKEIRKYLYNEYFKYKDEFCIQDELFNIIKIHNNKLHTITNCIPKDIRDLEDENEIALINNNIIKILNQKNKDFNIIDYRKKYIFDSSKVFIKNNKLMKNNKSKKKKNPKKNNLRKVPVEIISDIDAEKEEYLIEVKKDVDIYYINDYYKITIDLLEKVDEKLWLNIIN